MASGIEVSVAEMLVGDVRNVREAIQQVEAMAPCVLQMDEIEKGFGSVGNDGDSGASLRAFGTVLKWMSERTHPVYIIMTANDVSRLPMIRRQEAFFFGSRRSSAMHHASFQRRA